MTSVFDLDVAVVKSDSAISSELAGDLKVACLPLESVAPKMKDWHPGSDGKVLDLVHPSLFPLIYGRSKVLASGRVALEDSVEYAGKGEIIEVPNESQVKPGSSYAGGPYWVGRKAPFFWSKNFQWLPCQVNFTDNEEIKITSYINNLHPVKYQDLYTVIAKCIAKSVPLWNRTLSSTKSSRKPRIDMGMTQYDFPQGQETPDDYRLDGVYNDYERRNTWETTTRVLILPEPDDYALYEASGDNKIDLRTQFRSTGLQVIVKLANIELSPEKPDYDGGSWHIEGQLNERICASALYYYDSENITESFLAFRHRVDDDIETKAYEQVGRTIDPKMNLSKFNYSERLLLLIP